MALGLWLPFEYYYYYYYYYYYVHFHFVSLDETDFLGSKYPVLFDSTSVPGTVECIDLEIIDDYVKEDNESFVAVLSPKGDEAVHLLNHYAYVYIIDDDRTLTVSEESGNFTLISCRGECNSVTGESSWYSLRGKWSYACSCGTGGRDRY